MPYLGKQALVIGASSAGLASAHALADHGAVGNGTQDFVVCHRYGKA